MTSKDSTQPADPTLPQDRPGRWRRWITRFFQSDKSAEPASFEGADGVQFRDEVQPQELEYIADRRQAAFGPDSKNQQETPESAKSQLLGLAFSGGGIRSATFNLGVLQALERRGIFKFVDYLSTVSGGGFLGCSLSSILSRKAAEKKAGGPAPEFPFKFSEAEEETPAVSYLRNNSNYLAPDGPVDYLRIFAVLVRGIILNFLVLVPFLLLFSLIVSVFYGQAIVERLQEDDEKAEIINLLDRNWIGMDSDEPVSELMGALRYRGMLDSYRASPEVIVAWLRGDEKRGGRQKMEALPALISLGDDYDEDNEPDGQNSGNRQFAEYVFVEDATTEQLVDRLWSSGTLRNLDSLREIDSVERAVRASPVWESSAMRTPKLGVINLYRTLYRFGRPDYDNDDPVLPDCRPVDESGDSASSRGRALPECPLTTGDSRYVLLPNGKNIKLLSDCDDAAGGLRRFLEVVFQKPENYIEDWENADCATLLSDENTQQLRAPDDRPNLRRILEALSENIPLGANGLAETGRQPLVDLMEKAVRASPAWKSSEKRKKPKLGVLNLYQSLYSVGRPQYQKDGPLKPDCKKDGEDSPTGCEEIVDPLLPHCEDEQGGLKRFLSVLDEPTDLIGDWTDPSSVGQNQCDKLLQDPDLQKLRAVGEKPNLRRILQELYARGIYNPDALNNMRPARSTGIQSDGFAYWDSHLVAMIERKEAPQAATCKELLEETPEVKLAFLKPRHDNADTRKSLCEELGLSAQDTLHSTVRALWKRGYISQQHIKGGKPYLIGRPATCKQLLEEKPLEELSFVEQPDNFRPSQQDVCETLDLTDKDSYHKTIRTLWNKGLISEHVIDYPHKANADWWLWTAVRGVWDEIYGNKTSHPPYYQVYEKRSQAASTETIDPNLFRVHMRPAHDSNNARDLNPFRNPLLFTRYLLILGFAWVLLYPVLSLVRRHLYGLQNFKGALWWRNFYERTFSWLLIAIGVVALFEFLPLLIYHYRHLQAGQIWWPVGIGVASLFVSMIAGPAIALCKGFGKTVVLIVVALMGPVLPFLVFIHLVLWGINADALWSGYYVLNEWLLVFATMVAFIAAHVVNLAIDVNSTSLHGFYRDRLSHSYLLRSNEDGSVSAGEDLPLSEVCVSGSGAPYPLINATLNLQGTTDPSLRRRRGDFFQFSKYYVGSKKTGYCRTEALQKVFPQLYVSSAMAVSAAAAAPNMGTFTSGPLVVLMSLLNIRLGFWLPNPLRVNRWRLAGNSALGRTGLLLGSVFGLFRARPGAYLLIREMLSRLRADSRLVNVSDGGHMENTGIYELLRRRCQFIIAGDGEADPKMHFGGLAALIRYARIDLGIEIGIHVDDLRLDDNGRSRQHCAVGVIRYPETATSGAEVGYLLYIKSSITGDEDEVVSEYHRKSALFPHEPTADQFFDEGQFEAYRALGYHICDGLFDEIEKGTVDTFEECSEWFESLSISLSPGLAGKLAFADIQNELGNIERMLREPGYKHYFYEIYPDLEPTDVKTEELSPEVAAEAFRRVFHLVNIQLQLMESVFVSVELGQKANREHPSNRGWMNLFQRWARAPSFKRAYLPSITTFSAPFQQFCRVALGLGLELQWEDLGEERRQQLAGHADNIGLDGLKSPAPEGGCALLLTASLKGTSQIMIGETLLFIEDHEAKVAHLNLVAGYKGTGMRARSMLSLKAWARSKGLELSFTEAATIVARGPDFAGPADDE